MDAQTDAQLLRTYAERRSDPAFAALVRRHIDLVHSAARRMVCDAHLAEDVTQATFLALAKNAAQLTERPVLAGWLHRTAQNIAAQTVRTDVRRRTREQEAAAMNELLADGGTGVPPAWSEIAPHLDAALGDLTEPERAAVLLRYFERKSAREMAQTLGISDEAAQKRVSRAVERLREFFVKRGVTVGASGLAVVISANAVQAAPAGLALTISTAAALTGTTLATTATAIAIKTLAMTTIQKTIVTATIAVLAGAGIYEARQTLQLRDQVQTLQQQQAPLAEQIEQLQHERDEATKRLVALNDEFAKNKMDNSELLKLRGEVARLRRESQELAQVKSNAATKDDGESAAKALLDRIQLLKQRLEETPSEKNPEIQFLTEFDWIEAAKRKLDTHDNYRAAFSKLRASGEGNFLRKAETALRNYLGTNNNTFPTDLSQLKPFFDNPPPDEILQRYQIVPADTLPQANMTGHTDDWLITLKSPDAGTLWMLGKNGVAVCSYDAENTMAILAPALKTLFNATPIINGSRKVDIHQLAPYLTTPEQKAAYQRLMNGDKPASQ